MSRAARIDPNRTRTCLVVGAGIGGAAAALALVRAGFDVLLCEKARAAHEVGAGIVLWGNAVAALRAIGAEGPVLARASPMGLGELRSARGRLLARQDLTAWDRELGEPSVVIHRARLLEALLAQLDPARVRFASECVALEEREDSVRVRFADGRVEQADLVVGADGLHSRVRACLAGERTPRYAGYTCWRALARVPHELVPAGAVCETWGRGARFGWLRIPDGEVYWFATLDAPPGQRDASPEAARAQLARVYAGWWGPIEALIAATEPAQLLRHDILDRPPLPRGQRPFGRGRVTLLGDAAHPTTPNIGQGACLAIEDALALAGHLARAPLEPALAAYERERHARTAAIVRLSWHLGRVGQLRNPLACGLRDVALRFTPQAAIRRQHRRTVGFRLPGLPFPIPGGPTARAGQTPPPGRP